MSTIKGYKPHNIQRAIHQSINNGEWKYYCLNIGRQFGKSMLALNQLLYWAINNKGCQIAYVTPVYKQGKKVFSDFERYTVNSGIFEFNKSELLIKGCGSTIQFFSGERPDNIRGNTFDFLIVDEMAFTRKELWDEVLSATVLVKGKKVLFISTPNGKNHFYKLCMRHLDSEKYKYFHFTSYDNPLIDPQEIDDRKLSIPDHVFRQEYLAEFIDGGIGIFKNIKSVIKNINGGSKYYAGVDIGRSDDYTVLTVLNEAGQMVFVDRWRHMEWTQIVDKVCEVVKRYDATTLVEVNNQGDVFFELLKKKHRKTEHFTTTVKTKPQVIENLAVAFEQQALSILPKDWLENELENFTYIYSQETRAIKYGAPSGMHDDGVMSLAIAWHCFLNYKTKGRYVVV
jgi:hypothetical protein